jgi:hypothetical protein
VPGSSSVFADDAHPVAPSDTPRETNASARIVERDPRQPKANLNDIPHLRGRARDPNLDTQHKEG